MLHVRTSAFLLIIIPVSALAMEPPAVIVRSQDKVDFRIPQELYETSPFLSQRARNTPRFSIESDRYSTADFIRLMEYSKASEAGPYKWADDIRISSLAKQCRKIVKESENPEKDPQRRYQSLIYIASQWQMNDQHRAIVFAAIKKLPALSAEETSKFYNAVSFFTVSKTFTKDGVVLFPASMKCPANAQDFSGPDIQLLKKLQYRIFGHPDLVHGERLARTLAKEEGPVNPQLALLAQRLQLIPIARSVITHIATKTPPQEYDESTKLPEELRDLFLSNVEPSCATLPSVLNLLAKASLSNNPILGRKYADFIRKNKFELFLRHPNLGHLFESPGLSWLCLPLRGEPSFTQMRKWEGRSTKISVARMPDGKFAAIDTAGFLEFCGPDLEHPKGPIVPFCKELNNAPYHELISVNSTMALLFIARNRCCRNAQFEGAPRHPLECTLFQCSSTGEASQIGNKKWPIKIKILNGSFIALSKHLPLM